MGKPVIVSDAGALPELVMPDRSGWLVPAGDVALLAAALERALALDQPARERLGRQAREFAGARFDLERTAARTIEVYEELARPGRVGAPPRADPGIIGAATD